MKRSLMCFLLLIGMVAMGPIPSSAAATRTKTVGVPKAGLTVTYPVGWYNVPLTKNPVSAWLKVARKGDPTVTREMIRSLLTGILGPTGNADLIVWDPHSGDILRVQARDDPFDTSTVSELRRSLEAEFKQQGLLTLISIDAASVGSQPAYRFNTTSVRGRILAENLFFAHPATNATVTVNVTTDKRAERKRVADMILDSVSLA